ncbi:MAG: ATP synthase F0 subunit B [Acidobacteriota bacterium]
MLDLDISVLFVIAILWITLLILNKIYYKPVGKIMDERESKIERDSKEIEDLALEIDEKSGEIETILKNAKKESMKIKEELIKKGDEVRENILSDSRDGAKKLFSEKMSELERELKRAEEQLKEQVDIFSSKIEEIFS